MRHQEQSYQLTIADEQPRTTFEETKNRVRHIYLEEENIYGRFVPYLLLKDQLESEVDSSGNTALHHMCSHNSPYIPLFLSSIPHGDPILNRKSKLGHTPLDVAGLYCSREIVQMLKAKGAIDTGNADFWAIQGGNISNWSGKIYPNQKSLIHWAAYNDMPEVIAEYAKEGVSVSDSDSNGLTPIDLTILNKSYNSMRVLSDLGERPKAEILAKSDSRSIKQHFKKLDEKPTVRTIKQLAKVLSLLFYLLCCLIVNQSQLNMGLLILTMAVIIHLLLKRTKNQQYMDNSRQTEFKSELLLNTTINKNNHITYLLLHILVVSVGAISIVGAKITSHIIALLILVIAGFILTYGIHLCVQIYGICQNLTYDQMFYAHKWPHLWDNIHYVQERNILIRKFSNPENRGKWRNVKDYFGF